MNKIKIGIVGDGLAATHFAHYLQLENILFRSWSRKKDLTAPGNKLSECSIVLLLIRDDSIEDFISNNPKLKRKTLIHFSGSLSTPEAIGFHPLMTFSKKLYTLEKYRTIPFIGVKDAPDFNQFFPTLKNPFYTINEEQKSHYHALCVLSGNLTTLLWLKASTDFKEKLDLPKEILFPYLEQICNNIEEDPFNALTGPIKRGDKSTIKKNKKALRSRIWSRIYTLFNKVYKEELK